MPSTNTGSAHQAPYCAGQATRPAQYPQSIIWNLEDCKLYPGIVTETNLSRPVMEKCIRHEDGSEISSKEWNSIKASARLLVNIYLIALKSPADPSAKMRTKTKTYYSKYFPQVWSDVVEKLEDGQPLVGLCASHWKAEHIIANCLQVNIDNEKKKRKVNADPSPPSEGYGDGEQDRMDIDVMPASSKRGPEETELPGKKKQKTKKSTVAASTRKGQLFVLFQACDLINAIILIITQIRILPHRNQSYQLSAHLASHLKGSYQVSEVLAQNAPLPTMFHNRKQATQSISALSTLIPSVSSQFI